MSTGHVYCNSNATIPVHVCVHTCQSLIPVFHQFDLLLNNIEYWLHCKRSSDIKPRQKSICATFCGDEARKFALPCKTSLHHAGKWLIMCTTPDEYRYSEYTCTGTCVLEYTCMHVHVPGPYACISSSSSRYWVIPLLSKLTYTPSLYRYGIENTWYMYRGTLEQ